MDQTANASPAHAAGIVGLWAAPCQEGAYLASTGVCIFPAGSISHYSCPAVAHTDLALPLLFVGLVVGVLFGFITAKVGN